MRRVVRRRRGRVQLVLLQAGQQPDVSDEGLQIVRHQVLNHFLRVAQALERPLQFVLAYVFELRVAQFRAPSTSEWR